MYIYVFYMSAKVTECARAARPPSRRLCARQGAGRVWFDDCHVTRCDDCGVTPMVSRQHLPPQPRALPASRAANTHLTPPERGTYTNTLVHTQTHTGAFKTRCLR